MAKYLRVLYIGDIMGRPGREVVKAMLPKFLEKYAIDLTIAQAENVSHGKGMTPAHMRELQAAGVDVFTGGNHTIERPATLGLLDDPYVPVLAPINQMTVKPGWGVKTFESKAGTVLIISLLGTTFSQRAELATNPLLAVDNELSKRTEAYVARIVNFHGDLSSEKRVIGYYLDGRVSAVIGDHWHVPTADPMILPNGTAHITDVGMCGTLHTSLGVTKEIIISRWRDETTQRNEIAEGGPYQFNAVCINVDTTTGLATTIEQIQEYKDSI